MRKTWIVIAVVLIMNSHSMWSEQIIGESDYLDNVSLRGGYNIRRKVHMIYGLFVMKKEVNELRQIFLMLLWDIK